MMVASYIATDGTFDYVFVEGSNSLIMKIGANNSIQVIYIYPTGYQAMESTPDAARAVIWTSQTSIRVVNLADGSSEYTFAVPNIPPYLLTQKIAFSADSTLAII